MLNDKNSINSEGVGKRVLLHINFISKFTFFSKCLLAMYGRTRRLIFESWKGIPVEVLKHYISSIHLLELTEEIPIYIKDLDRELDSLESEPGKNSKMYNENIDKMIDYIWRFSTFDIDINWTRIIKRLLVSLDSIQQLKPLCIVIFKIINATEI